MQKNDTENKERENGNKKGIKAVIASFAIQLTLGVCYIWSVFQTGVAISVFGGNHAHAGLAFSILLAFLSFFSPVAGKLSAKHGTRKVVFSGGILLGIGFFLASLTTAGNGWLLWLGYGVIGGIGMGLTYSTTIGLAQKWFPNKKGLVTGIIVAGLGLGGVVFTPIIEFSIQHFGGIGYGEFGTFAVLAVVFLAVCSIGSIFLAEPPKIEAKNNKEASKNAASASISNDVSPAEMLKKLSFYLVTFTFLLSVVGGLMMIAFARPIAVARDLEHVATIGVLSIAMANSLGRLFWGAISDKLGRINTVFILLLGSAVLSLLVNVVDGYLIFIVIALIGFLFGGFLSNFPSLTAELFGVKNLATNYGFVLFGFGIGAIAASQIGGHFMNIASEDISLLAPAFIIAAVCALVGFVLIFLLKANLKKTA
ncbi:MAG: OFA family MFS transporter [Defluviitaleaceae bacterium]|nr:OFA family MFS transporter [Defluviitaleaceae bacterium]